MKKKVLIVEGHEHFRKLLSMYLSKSFQVLPASNGLEAMGWIQKGMVPNVIISGYGVQGPATEEFFNSLSCSGLFSHTPVISLLPDNISKSVNLSDLQKRIQYLAGNSFQQEPVEQPLVAEGAEVVLN